MNGKVRINLLPPELAGKITRRATSTQQVAGPGTNPMVVIIVLFALALSGYFCYSLYSKKVADDTLTAEMKDRMDRLEKELTIKRTEFKEFRQIKELVNSLWEVLNAIDPPNRLLWSEKLLMLADLVPKNVFITKIKIIEKETQVVTEESKQALSEWQKKGSLGPKPEEKKKPVIHQEMTISCLSRTDVTEKKFDPILEFIEAMQNYKLTREDKTEHSFLENFTGPPTYGEIKATTYDGVPVYQFDFFLTTKPLSAQQ